MTKNIRPNFADTTVLEERFEMMPRDHSSLIRVAERSGMPRAQFNGLENQLTREVTVTGIKLAWDGSNKALDALKLTRDVTRITVIADEVEISEPLQWKGADVEIFARRLVFKKNGQISTTPVAYATTAFTPTRDAKGRPLAASGGIKAMDGRPGERGGNIDLHLHELELGAISKVRFVLDGSPGETGEPGGLLDFKGFTDGPATKDVSTVSLADVKAAIKNTSNSHPDLGALKHWWTNEGRGEEGLNKAWKAVDKLKGYQVTDVRLGLHFLQFLARFGNVVKMPAMTLVRHDLTGKTHSALFKDMKQFIATNAPSDGEDAFASGATGKGGNAGVLGATPNAKRQISEDQFRAQGGASPASALTQGGAAGTPSKYALVAMICLQDSLDLKRFAPQFFVTPRERKAGKDAAGSALGAGADAKALQALNAHSWLDPRLLTVIADYGRALFAAGHRGEAWAIMSFYWEELRNRKALTMSAEVRAGAQVINNLVQNCRHNLDVYGNPPGWVPRFSADGYLKTYLSDRRFSYRFLGVMDNAVRLMNSVEQASAMLGVVAQQTEDVIDQIRKDLITAYQQYASAHTTIRQAEADLKRAEAKLENLEQRALDLALIQQQDKAVVEAVFTVSAAILEAIPVYQPGLSAVATVVKGAGQFTVASLYGDKPTTAWKALSTIGGSVETALKDNAKTINSKLAESLASEHGLDIDKDKVDLQNQIAQLETSLQEGQSQHDASMVKIYDKVSDNESLSMLLRTDKEAENLLVAQSANPSELQRRIAEYNRLIVDLKEHETGGSDFAMALATRRRQNLLAGRAKLYTALADAQNQVADMRSRGEKDAKLMEQAEARRVQFEKNRAELDKLLPELTELESAETVKKTAKTYASLIEGVERIAKSTAVIGDSIHGVVRGPDPDSEEVAALKARILANDEMREDYLEAQTIVDEAQAAMQQAFAQLLQGNQAITTLTSDFTGSLQSSIAISRNRLQFALGVDGGLKSSLVAMRRQAEARMEYFLYLFRRAYMYETCTSAGKDVASLNTLTQNIDSWLDHANAAAKQLNDTKDENLRSLQFMNLLRQMKESDATSAADDALKNILAELAANILKARQSAGLHFDTTLGAALPDEARLELARTGEVEIPEVMALLTETGRDGKQIDMRKFFFASPKRKIARVLIEPGDFLFRKAKGSRAKNLRLRISFGRELILWSDGKFYGFRIGDGEQPLEMRWTAKEFLPTADPEIFSAKFEADKTSSVNDVFKTIMQHATGQSLDYSEINPSFLAPMTVSLLLGHGMIEDITQFDLKLGMQAN